MNITKLNIPLNVITEGANLILLEVVPYYAYVDGKKTDTLKGYRYTVVEDETFEKLSIKIESATPIVSSEQLASAKSHVLVTFDKAFAKPYRTNSGDFELSISASNMLIVK